MDGGSLSDTQRTMVLPLLQETNIRGRPYVTVSSKRIANGLSRYPNDGADFGPDTTLNATAPGQYGSPYTETTGLKEAINYGIATGTKSGTGIFVPEIKIISPFITISAPITVQAPSGYTISQFKVSGISSMTYVNINLSGAYAITLDPSSFSDMNMRFENLQPSVAGGSPYGFLDADFSTANGGTNAFEGYNLDVSNTGWATAPFYLKSFAAIFMYNYESYSGGSTTYGNGYFDAINIFFFGVQGTSVNYFFSNATFVYIAGLSQDSQAGTSYSAGISLTNVISAVIEDAFSNISLGSNITNLIIINQTQGSQNPVSIASSVSGTSRTITNFKLLGFYNYGTNPYFSSDIVISGPSVSIPANPPVTATVYQNTNPYDIRLKIPVTYSPTSTAAATLATGISSTSTVSTSTKVSIPAGVTAGEILTYDMVVPAGQYFELVVTNATIGTAEVQAV